jgi:hypothetical protein
MSVTFETMKKVVFWCATVDLVIIKVSTAVESCITESLFLLWNSTGASFSSLNTTFEERELPVTDFFASSVKKRKKYT